MDFIERNELYDAKGRVYRVESYEADITTGGTEINGEFRGPVPWKKAPKMPGNRQIGHLDHFIDAAGNTVYLNGDAELHGPDDDDAHSDAAALRKSHSGSMRFRVTGQQAQAFNDSIMRTIFESKVERIITNGRSTIVCWKDGTKTRVALSAGEDTDGSVYEGFMWACAKKLFGSHRRFERLVDGVHVDQDRRGEKPEKPAKRACRSGRKSADAKHL